MKAERSGKEENKVLTPRRCRGASCFIQKQGKPSATAVEGAKFSLRAGAEAPPVLSKTGKDIFPFYPHNRGMGENMASLTGIKKEGGEIKKEGPTEG